MNVLSLPTEAAPEALDGAASVLFRSLALVAIIALSFFDVTDATAAAPAATRPATARSSVDPRFAIGDEVLRDDFDRGLGAWTVEAENGGTVEARDGVLVIDAPAGCTVWLRRPLVGPLMIEYEATVVARGGVNDRVSDLNCFWMARDARHPDELFAAATTTPARSGKFEEYNFLRGYYVGLGGNGNTTSRFRRYIGDAVLRPLLPQHDLHERDDLLVPNAPITIRLVACGNLVQYWRDDRRMFELIDDAPYTSGHFAFRTVRNHMEVRRFRVYRLLPIASPPTTAAATTRPAASS